jgi:hypothetical protein
MTNVQRWMLRRVWPHGITRAGSIGPAGGNLEGAGLTGQVWQLSSFPSIAAHEPRRSRAHPIMCPMENHNPIIHLTPRATFLDRILLESINAGPCASALFNYPHDSWKEAADEGGRAGSDAAVAEVNRTTRGHLATDLCPCGARISDLRDDDCRPAFFGSPKTCI